MLIPIRCFTCGKVVANKWQRYTTALTEGQASGQILDELGLVRYCCRRMLISHVELLAVNNNNTHNTQHNAPAELPPLLDPTP